MIRATALAFLALAAPAGAFQLAFPADCTLGDTCYVQQYVDHDAGPGARDFTCGGLSYDGHDGTDLALPTRAAMAAGVNVLAAAPGVVKGMRDGVADFAPVVPGKECGNGVLIDHGDGWQTQYCHMKQGSVAVRAGDRVNTGAVLGQIGQSGMAEFPHLHITLRHNGETVDPFAPEALATCGPAGDELWADPLPYQPGGVIGIGIADAVPEYEAIKAGLDSPDMAVSAPALVVWAFLYGSQPGDVVKLALTGPDGTVIAQDVPLDKAQAQLFRAVGKKRPAGDWPAGTYTGTAELIRDGESEGAETVTIQLAP